jgi:hypothetical protein
MSEQNADLLAAIARFSHDRARAERALSKAIVAAYLAGVSIHRIARVANLTRSAIYQRLWVAGVKERTTTAAPDLSPPA